jgi:spermidine dehydrogenase
MLPPALTGLRGSHVGCLKSCIALRDGHSGMMPGKPTDTGEVYDLVGSGVIVDSRQRTISKSAGPKPKFSSSNHDDLGTWQGNSPGRQSDDVGFVGSIRRSSYSAVAKAL